MVKKHVRPTAAQHQGGIAEQESRIALSNVQLVADLRPVRLGTKCVATARCGCARSAERRWISKRLALSHWLLAWSDDAGSTDKRLVSRSGTSKKLKAKS